MTTQNTEVPLNNEAVAGFPTGESGQKNIAAPPTSAGETRSGSEPEVNSLLQTMTPEQRKAVEAYTSVLLKEKEEENKRLQSQVASYNEDNSYLMNKAASGLRTHWDPVANEAREAFVLGHKKLQLDGTDPEEEYQALDSTMRQPDKRYEPTQRTLQAFASGFVEKMNMKELEHKREIEKIRQEAQKHQVESDEMAKLKGYVAALEDRLKRSAPESDPLAEQNKRIRSNHGGNAAFQSNRQPQNNKELVQMLFETKKDSAGYAPMIKEMMQSSQQSSLKDEISSSIMNTVADTARSLAPTPGEHIPAHAQHHVVPTDEASGALLSAAASAKVGEAPKESNNDQDFFNAMVLAAL